MFSHLGFQVCCNRFPLQAYLQAGGETAMDAKRTLMALMVGAAMLLTPVPAAAHSKDKRATSNSHASRVSRSSDAPARSSVSPRNFGSAKVHNNAPGNTAKRSYGTADDYRNYGRDAGSYRGAPAYPNRGYAGPAYPGHYYGRPGYVYGGPGYVAADPCRAADSVLYNYYRDRNTGHPAAAFDLLAHNQWAFHSGCGAPPYTGPMYGGFAPWLQQLIR